MPRQHAPMALSLHLCRHPTSAPAGDQRVLVHWTNNRYRIGSECIGLCRVHQLQPAEKVCCFVAIGAPTYSKQEHTRRTTLVSQWRVAIGIPLDDIFSLGILRAENEIKNYLVIFLIFKTAKLTVGSVDLRLVSISGWAATAPLISVPAQSLRSAPSSGNVRSSDSPANIPAYNSAASSAISTTTDSFLR